MNKNSILLVPQHNDIIGLEMELEPEPKKELVKPEPNLNNFGSAPLQYLPCS